jgi:hypothetical protein
MELFMMVVFPILVLISIGTGFIYLYSMKLNPSIFDLCCFHPAD